MGHMGNHSTDGCSPLPCGGRSHATSAIEFNSRGVASFLAPSRVWTARMVHAQTGFGEPCVRSKDKLGKTRWLSIHLCYCDDVAERSILNTYVLCASEKK